METVSTKLVLAGALLALTIVTGFILSRAGRPLGLGLTTVHKLIAVGAIVLMVLAFRQIGRTNGVAGLSIAMAIISAILFVSLVATGALLTREEMQLPRIVLGIHRVAPFAVLCTSVMTFLLMNGARS